MKNIYYILIVILLNLFVTSCSDENESAILNIVDAQTEYTAMGGEGKIVVKTSEPITAKSDKDWCKAIVLDDIVTLTVSSHLSLESRYAYITIASGNQLAYAVVIQKGVVTFVEAFGTLNFSAKGGEMSFKLHTEAPFEIEVGDSWLKYEIKNGELVLTTEASPDGRSTYVKLISKVAEGEVVQRFDITQGLHKYESMLGDWTMSLYDVAAKKEEITTVTFKEKGSNKYFFDQLAISGSFKANITVDFDPIAIKLIIKPMQYIGETSWANGKYTYLRTMSSGLSASNTVNLVGHLINDDPFTFVFKDDSELWGYSEQSGFMFAPSTTEGPEGVLNSYWKRYTTIVLTKLK